VYRIFMQLITDSDTLSAFCKKVASSSDFITVDTEFVRESTYWSQLCLIQVAGENNAAAIDALADEIDLSSLFNLLRDQKLTKVFHAARQDLEIFYQLMNDLPSPIADTQIAAMVCGFGDSVGYETLVNKLAKKTIDKSMRFTDWRRRPLSDKQLLYAISDVTHLRLVYEKLRDILNKNGREHWISEEMARLSNPGTYILDPKDAWKRLKVKSHRPRFLLLLQEIAAWRETEAQKRNIPRNQVLRDEAILEIAAQEPRDIKSLGRMRSMKRGLPKGEALSGLLRAIKTGSEIEEAKAPSAPSRSEKAQDREGSRELIKVLLKYSSEKHGIAQRLIITSNELEELISKIDLKAPVFNGWRNEIFGKHALKLLNGKLAISSNGPKIMLVEPGPEI
jgi:ribonuclease D